MCRLIKVLREQLVGQPCKPTLGVLQRSESNRDQLQVKKITRIGIGGPVGSGKTALVEGLAPLLIGMGVKVLVITNDVVTTEDAKQVKRTLKGILLERILGVETGACPHTAVREDPSMNLAAVEEMEEKFPDTDVVLIESGGG